MSKLKKMLWVFQRGIIKKIDGFDSRKYMKNYCEYLKKIGVDLCARPIYIHSTVVFDGIDYSKIHIGQDVVISRNGLFLIHDYSI